MKTRTSTWYECKIRYEKMMEDGTLKKVTEAYTVEALSFTEAEANIIKEMSAYISGEFEVIDIKKAAYNEVFFSDSSCSDDNWYKCKVQFITIDEKTEKEKRTSVCYLVNAHNIISCHKVIDDAMSNCMIDCDTVAVQKTKILDVFEYHK